MTKQNQNNPKPQFVVKRAIISADRLNKEIDITQNLAELNIFESLNTPYLTGKCAISDDQGLFDALEFQGTEILELEIGASDTDNTTAVLNKRFYMIGIEKQTKANQSASASVFVFDLIDEHGFLGRIQKISKSYTGSLEKIVKSILQNELGRRVDIGYTGAKTSSDELSAQQDITCIIPNLTAIDAIKWLTSRITTPLGSPYFVYATLVIPDLRGDIVNNISTGDDEDRRTGSIVRLGNLDTMLVQPAFNKIPYKFSPSTVGSGAEEEPEIQTYTIKNIDIGSSSNTLSLLEQGAVASSYSNTNLSTGEISKTRHLLSSQLLNLDQSKIIQRDGGLVQNIFDTELRINDVQIDDYTPKEFHTVTSTGTYGSLKSYHDETDESKFKLKMQSRALFSALHKNPLKVVVEGASLLTTGISVGDIIDLAILGDDIEAAAAGESPLSPRYSGNHLIYNLRHVFTDTTHNCVLDVVKLESRRKVR
jgi:hypothetical protein